MKTIAVQALPDSQSEWLEWIEAGEEIAISKQGKIIAHFVPVKSEEAGPSSKNPSENKVDWTTSAAFTMDRSKIPMLTAEQVASVLEENRGNW